MLKNKLNSRYVLSVTRCAEYNFILKVDFKDKIIFNTPAAYHKICLDGHMHLEALKGNTRFRPVNSTVT